MNSFRTEHLGGYFGDLWSPYVAEYDPWDVCGTYEAHRRTDGYGRAAAPRAASRARQGLNKQLLEETKEWIATSATP